MAAEICLLLIAQHLLLNHVEQQMLSDKSRMCVTRIRRYPVMQLPLVIPGIF